MSTSAHINKQIAGLSVWTWGPTFWSILNLLAYHSDETGKPTTVFANVGALCPCSFCRASYPQIFATVQARGHKEMQHVVYDIHSLVSEKLARQAWDTYKATYPEWVKPDAPYDSILVKAPTYDTFKKRMILNDTEPVCSHDVLLLMTVLASRITPDTRWNFLLFASSTALALQAVRNGPLQRLGVLLEAACVKLRQGDGSGFRDAFVEVIGTDPEPKMRLMVAGACVSGTCV